MIVTFILPTYPWKPKGGFRVVYEYANHLVSRGHQVAIVHPRRLTGDYSKSPANLSAFLYRKSKNLRDYFLRPNISWQPIDPRVRMIFVAEPFPQYVPDGDAVVATFWPTAEVVADYSMIKGKKFYLVQDFYPYLGPQKQIESSWKLPLKKIAISHWLQDLVIKSGASCDLVVSCGIDGERFRREQPFPERPRQIAMLYATQSYKTPTIGLQAVELARKKYPDLQMVCFGPGPQPPKFPPWAQYRRNVVETELVALYNDSAVFLSSSVAEGFCLPPAEAMACGCAVVATDSGGIREYARNGENALLSPPNDPVALSVNLVRLLDDEPMRVRLATAGFQRIQEFTWKRSVDELERFLIEQVG